MTVLELSKRSGVFKNTILEWRHRTNPSLTNFEACANALGYKIMLVPMEDEEVSRQVEHFADMQRQVAELSKEVRQLKEADKARRDGQNRIYRRMQRIYLRLGMQWINIDGSLSKETK